LELLFGGLEALELHGVHLAEIVPVMVTVPIVVTQHATIVTLVQLAVDVGKVVAHDPALLIDPDLASQDPAAALPGEHVNVVGDFSYHDALYHHSIGR
jgi:hypothetical protein